MSNNNFMLSIIATLNKQLSAKSIQGDLKTLDNKFYIKILAKLSKTLATKELQNQLKELNNLYVQVGANVKVDKNAKSKLEQNIKMLQRQISDLEIGLKASKKQQAKLHADIDGIKKRLQSKINSEPLEFNLELKKSKLISDIEYLGKRYSKLFSNTSASKKYENLMQNALSITGKGQLADTRTELAAFTSELKANGLASKSTGDKWRNLVDRSKDLFSAAAAVPVVFSQMRQAVSTTLSIDKLLTDYSKVQDDITRSDYPEYLESCNKKAQNLATTQEALIESATEFSKSGYDMSKSDALSERAIKLSNVGDMSASDSVKAIISGVQAYDTVDGYDDVLNKTDALIDKYNEIGNTASITTEEIAKGVQSVGSVFADANTSVDEFIALLTAGNRQFQDADSLALGLRTSALRIRGCTAELEAMGEETDGVITSTSKLAEKIKAITNINGSGGVKILEEDEQTFRSIYDIYTDIGKVYQQMSDSDQSALLELIAGKHRASGISAVLNNMTEAQQILQDSLSSAGSADKEYEKYMESAEAHINQFQAKLVETYSTFMSGDTIKYAADFGSAMLDILNYTDLLHHGLLAIASIKIGQSISTIGLSIADAAKQMNTLGSAIQKVNSLSSDNTLRKTALKEIGDATKGLTDKNLKLLLSQKQLTAQEKIAILKQHDLSKKEAEAKLIKMGLISATKAQTVANTANTTSTFTLSGALTALKASAIGAGQAIKAAFLSNPIGIALMAVTTVVSGLSTKISNHNQALEETRRANIEASASAAEAADNLKNLYMEYETLNSIQDKTVTQEEEYRTVIEKITAALGDKTEALKGLKQGTEEYTAKLKELTQAELQDQRTAATVGRKSAEESLQDTIWSDWGGSKVSIDSNSKGKSLSTEAQQAVDVVSDTLKEYETINRVWDNISWDIKSDDPDDAVNFYNSLLQARTDLVNASKNNEALLDTQVYKDINSSINTMSSDLDTYIQTRYEELKLDYLVNHTIPTTVEEYRKMEDAIVGATSKNKGLQSSFQDLLAEDFPSLFAKTQVDPLEDASAFNPSQFSEQISALSSLQSAYNDFYQDVKDGVDFTFDFSEIESLREKFGDACSSFDEFERLATTTGTSSEAMQGAFDQLATEYVVSSGMLDGLNQSTREQIISQMELNGIVGAADLLTEDLASACGFLSQNGYELSDATDAAFWALLDEANASEQTKGAIYALSAAEIAYKNSGLNTSEKIEELQKLATQYGDNASAAIAAAAADRVAAGHGDYETILSDLMASIKRTSNTVKLSVGQSSANAAKSASKGAKDSKDAWLEAYKEQEAALEHSLAMEELSEQDYYARLQELNEAYFNDSAEHHEKYLDEYQSNEEKIFKGLKKIREDALKEEKSSLDDVISHMASLVDKKIDSYKDKMGSVTEEYEKQKDAAIARYDKEIKKVEEQIDAKQDEIDAIHDINDAMDKQKALEEALYNLRRAQNQKSRVYKQVDGTNGQVIYDVNSKEISSASDEVYKAQNELRISQLEQEKEALEELKDSYEEKKEKIEEYYDNLISSTEEYYNRLIEGQEAIKSRWEELSELQEQAEIQAKLDELGLLEQGVADMSDEAFQRLKLSYLDVLKDMNEGNGGILNQLSILSGVDMSGLMGYLETSQGMLAGLAGINIQPVNDSLALIPEQTAVAETAIVNTTEQAKQQIGQVSETLNNLTNDISAYQLPPLNTEQFSASLGADGVGGVLQDLNTFVQRFRDICGSIPQIWNDTLSILQGTQGSVSGEGTDYNSIFAPLITAMNNCKLQMDGKLTEYVNAWKQFNLDLGGIIGIGTSTGDSLALPTSLIKSKDASGGKDAGKSDSSEGGDTIVGSIQTGGKMITDSFTNEWIPAFSNLGTNINEICGKIVLCVNEMAAETVNACREAIDAINKANAAKKSSSSKNKKPAKFEGTAYVGQAFARGSDLSIDRTQVALVNEIGQEGIVRNGKLHTVYGGAQFVTLQKGDIVFNHKQMEELQKHRRVASGGGHGTMIGSFAGGSSLKINEPPKKLQAMITPEFKRAITPDLHLPGLERMLEPTGSPQTNIHQDIKVTLPNVTNEAGFRHFAKELKNLKLEALQRSYRRM